MNPKFGSLNKTPSNWLSNTRKSTVDSRPLNRSSQRDKSMKKSVSFNNNRSMVVNKKPKPSTETSFARHDNSRSFLGISRSKLDSQMQSKMRNSSFYQNKNSSFLNSSLTNRESRFEGNTSLYQFDSARRKNPKSQSLDVRNRIHELLNGDFLLLDKTKNDLQKKRLFFTVLLFIFLFFIDLLIFNLFKLLVEGEQINGEQGYQSIIIDTSWGVYKLVVFKLISFYIILRMITDSGLYEISTWNFIKKIVFINSYPLVSLCAFIFFQYNILNDMLGFFSFYLNTFAESNLTLFCFFMFFINVLLVFFSNSNKKQLGFVRNSLSDLPGFIVKSIKKQSLLFFAVNLFIFILLTLDKVIRPEYYYLPGEVIFTISFKLLYMKIFAFIFVYGFFTYDLYLFIAKIFLSSNLKHYPFDYKNITNILKLYHEVHKDQYAKDIDKATIEANILFYFRNELSLIYRAFFTTNRTSQSDSPTELYWNLFSRVFADELIKLEDTLIKARGARNKRYYNFLDKILYCTEYYFTQDKYQRVYEELRDGLDLFYIKLELIKELFTFNVEEINFISRIEDCQKLFKTLKSIYDCTLDLYVGLSNEKVNINRAPIMFMFETMVKDLEDILTKIHPHILKIT